MQLLCMTGHGHSQEAREKPMHALAPPHSAHKLQCVPVLVCTHQFNVLVGLGNSDDIILVCMQCLFVIVTQCLFNV